MYNALKNKPSYDFINTQKTLIHEGIELFKTSAWKEVFLNSKLLDPIEESFSGSVPMCSDCAFENYCGADPTYHYSIFKDFIGRKPESDFCNRNMTIIKHIFELMDSDVNIKKIFLSWIN